LENVAAYAIDKIRQGLTPNPDVMCNKLSNSVAFEQRVGKDLTLRQPVIMPPLATQR
jgi:tRNA U34 2-thiouridine synthase MnmA/TrmU